MKTIVLALLGVTSLANGAEWDALQVTYGQNGQGYYDLPWSVDEATSQGKWHMIDQDNKLNVDVFSQPQDPSLLLLFDKKGTIAGIRLAFLKDGIDEKAKEGGHTFEFDYDNNPMYEKGKYLGKDLWYTTVILASPSRLAGGGRGKLNKNSDELAQNVYLKYHGEWMELSRDECKPNAEFEEANCFAGMGKHYFRKGSNENCKLREPFWSLYDNGKLIGFGIAGFGSYSKNDSKTQTYYDRGSISVEAIMRNAPSCVEEYIQNYGMISMHVFLKKDASKITCPPEDWRKNQC